MVTWREANEFLLKEETCMACRTFIRALLSVRRLKTLDEKRELETDWCALYIEGLLGLQVGGAFPGREVQ